MRSGALCGRRAGLFSPDRRFSKILSGIFSARQHQDSAEGGKMGGSAGRSSKVGSRRLRSWRPTAPTGAPLAWSGDPWGREGFENLSSCLRPAPRSRPVTLLNRQRVDRALVAIAELLSAPSREVETRLVIVGFGLRFASKADTRPASRPGSPARELERRRNRRHVWWVVAPAGAAVERPWRACSTIAATRSQRRPIRRS